MPSVLIQTFNIWQGLPTRPAGEVAGRSGGGVAQLQQEGASTRVPSAGASAAPIKSTGGSIVGISSAKTSTAGSSSRTRESVGTSTESVGTSMRSSTNPQGSVEQGKKGDKVDAAERFVVGRVVGGQQQQVVLGKSEVVAIKLRGRDKAIRPR